MGPVGALVIARRSWGLIRDAGGVLLDHVPPGEALPDEMPQALETGADRITDPHLWRLDPGHPGAVVSLASTSPQPPSRRRAKRAHIQDPSHLTVEVEPPAA